MTPDQMREIGEVLYGPRWQTELGRRFGVSDRRIRAFVAGERTIPPTLAHEIVETIAQDRARQTLALIGEFPGIRRVAATEGRDIVGRRATEIVAEELANQGIEVRRVYGHS